MSQPLRLRAWIIILILVGQANSIEAIGQDSSSPSNTKSHPNVLFIALDDLNDWIGCLGGHPQTVTPNLDRLAASSLLFTNAHCAAPSCNPSRSAIFTGRAPNRSGLYDNRQPMREVMPDEVILPEYFRQHGYFAAGSGKLLHYFIDAKSWDLYFPSAASENPFPKTFNPAKRPVNLKRGGSWQYVETDWAALDVTDEEYGGDCEVANWICDQLGRAHDKPFFLGCGIYRPHEPWFVPQKYFDPFPLETIQLPPGYRDHDLDDVPFAGQSMARNRYFAHIREQGQWKQAIQAYLASIHFADAMVGRVLDALHSGPNHHSTIIIVWSDHGWQLGEKEHWQKYTPWRAVTRVPLIIHVPPASSNTFPVGTPPGAICDAPVNLLSLFPTLTDLCSLPTKSNNDGPSLVPLLENPRRDDWQHASVTYLATPGSYAVSGRTHRYIRYSDGSEELYDMREDPYEWTNLAARPDAQAALVALQSVSPKSFAKLQEPSIKSLPTLEWIKVSEETIPVSNPDGNPFVVHFMNRRSSAVQLYWIDREGKPVFYGVIEAGKTKPQQTRPGAIWMICETRVEERLGYFKIGDRSARAVIE